MTDAATPRARPRPVIATPMSGAEVARVVFNRAPDWIYRARNRDRLRALGFPEPGPFGWDPVAIAAWQDRQRTGSPAHAADNNPPEGRLADNAAAVAAQLSEAS